MNVPAQSLIRRLFLVLGVLVGITVLSAAIYRYTAQPKLTINAPIGSTVTVSGVDSTNSVQRTTTSQVITIFIGTGTYKLKIETADTKQLLYGSAHPFQHITYRLTAEKERHVVPVGNQVAYNAMQDGNGSVIYLDTTDHLIKSFTSGSAPATLQPAVHPSNDVIANPDSYFTQNIIGMHILAGRRAIVAANSLLYVVDTGGVRRLNMDGMPAAVNSVTIATNPGQGSFAVAVNNMLYWYQSADAPPKKLLAFAKKVDQMAYGGTAILAYATTMPPSMEDIRADYSKFAVDPIIVNIPDRTQHVFIRGPIVDASIAPDGRHAIVEEQGVHTMKLYDLTQGDKALYTTESSDTITPPWIDNAHYVYGKGPNIWEFDLATRAAASVGTLPGGQQATSITYDAAARTYLVTTYPNEAQAAIYRIGPR